MLFIYPWLQFLLLLLLLLMIKLLLMLLLFLLLLLLLRMTSDGSLPADKRRNYSSVFNALARIYK